jgi:hypothetical protein
MRQHTTKTARQDRIQNGPLPRIIAAHLRRAVTALRADMGTRWKGDGKAGMEARPETSPEAAIEADMAQVEFWLTALESCAKPLPDYESRYRRTRIPAAAVSFP